MNASKDLSFILLRLEFAGAANVVFIERKGASP